MQTTLKQFLHALIAPILTLSCSAAGASMAYVQCKSNRHLIGNIFSWVTPSTVNVHIYVEPHSMLENFQKF